MKKLEEIEEFINDYENIKESLEYLLKDVKNEDLKEEVAGFISILEEDYSNEYEENEDIIMQEENEDLKYQNQQFEYDRL